MTSSKRYDRIAFVASAGDEAQAALAQLTKVYGNHDAENADVVEAIRIAKLSGFLTVGFTVLGAPSGIEALIALHSQLKKLDLDGSLVFAADPTAELNRAAAAARNHLLDGRWSNLSRIFNEAGFRAWLRITTRAATPAERRTAAQANGTDLDLDEGAQA